MLTLTEKQIEQVLPKIEDGLIKYQWLQKHLQETDVSSDRNYQKRFNHFYRVRRSRAWQLEFYELLNAGKSNPISFSSALDKLQITTGCLEPSFSSKLVATIDPDLPVIDKFVLQNCGLRLPCSGANDRMLKIVNVYNTLTSQLNQILSSDIGGYLVSRFAREYPDAQITRIKMLDLVLWQIR